MGSMSGSEVCPPGADNQFGPQVNVDCRSFDFTLLFEDSFFVLLPAAVFLILLPARFQFIRKEPVKVDSYRLVTSKLALLAILFTLQLCYLALCLSGGSLQTQVSVSAGVLAAVAVLAGAVHSFMEDQRSVKPSDLLVIYLSATALLYIAPLRTLWIMDPTSNDNLNTARGLWTAIFAVTVVALFVESIRKTRILRPAYKAAVSKEQVSSFWAQSFYIWTLPLFYSGYSKVLQSHDMPKIDNDLREEAAGRRLEAVWRKSTTEKHRLVRAAARAYWWPLLSAVAPRLALSAFTFSQPFLIETAVWYIGDAEAQEHKAHGNALVGAFVLSYLGIAVSRAIYMRQTYRMITMLRAGLISMIYRHTMPLTAAEVKDSAAVTLMGTDVERIAVCLKNVHEIWASIPELSVAIYLLSRQLSIAAIVPPVICVISLVAITPVSARFGVAQKNWVEKVQTRVAITANMIGEMRAVKMLGYSKVLQDVIHKLRVVELDASEKFRKLRIWAIVISNCPQDWAPFVTFAVYAIYGVVTGNPLLSTQAFSSLALISLLTFPLLMLTQAVPVLIQALACFGRIEEYCLKSDLTPEEETLDVQSPIVEMVQEVPLKSLQAPLMPKTELELVSFRDASFSWSKDSPAALQNIDLGIVPGTTVIIGPVASGKSTLLASILGQTTQKCGTSQLPVFPAAYCAQPPWLMNTTVRNNITGDSEFDQKWYDFVTSACCLQADLDILPHGDLTLAGSGGSSLSGGQRQRVSLARAVYSRLPLVILDDVLSGLDPTTLSNVLDHLLGPQGYFKKARISVILATHSKQALFAADHIVALDGGKVIETGSLRDIEARAPQLVAQSVAHTEMDITEVHESKSSESKITAAEATVYKALDRARALQDDSSRKDGNWGVYKYYYRSAGAIPVLLWLGFTAIEAFGTNYATLWLENWSSASEENPNQDLGLYLGIYALLVVLATLGVWVGCRVFFVNIISNSALTLHSDLLKATLRAPYSFFQTTNTGEITNRFSQDMDLIDMTLPAFAVQFVTAAASCMAKLIILCILGKYLAITVPFLFTVLYVVQRYYLRTSRQVRLIDIEAKAPLYKHMIETIQGIVTIRALGWQSAFVTTNANMLDEAQKPFYMLKCIQQWLTLVLDLIVGGLAVVLISIATTYTNIMSAGEMGVALNLILTFNSLLTQTVESWTQLETSIGAVARVQNFLRDTPSDMGELDTPPSSEHTDWPSRGAIRLENVEASYGEDKPAALKGLSLDLRPGEKVAICGPSGSGKSSLILSLLRLMEVRRGNVVIDGVDLSTVASGELRESLNLIPQEPFFMPGSLRFNMDPHSRRSSDDIERALGKVGLWTRVNANGGLDMDLAASEWSHGERQLLCLARALLVRSKILILDEATSSVDEDTEGVMQDVIESEFPEQTVIAVLHRFKYIDRYDRVAVLKEGELVECDSPKSLLASDSAFRKLYMAHHSRQG